MKLSCRDFTFIRCDLFYGEFVLHIPSIHLHNSTCNLMSFKSFLALQKFTRKFVINEAETENENSISKSQVFSFFNVIYFALIRIKVHISLHKVKFFISLFMLLKTLEA